MIYELRTYEAMPGKLPALHRRFAEHTIKYFEKHGIKVIGFWTYLFGGPNDQLVYMLAYDNLAARERAWAAFQQDEEWLRVRAETERDGILVARLTAQILQPTPYSPLQ